MDLLEVRDLRDSRAAKEIPGRLALLEAQEEEGLRDPWEAQDHGDLSAALEQQDQGDLLALLVPLELQDHVVLRGPQVPLARLVH